MNVIVSNKKEPMLNALDIEIIKKVTGEYEIDEIISMFSNFFYQRMILDITSIKNYNDIKNLQKLSISLDMSKIILLLDESEESSSSSYLSKLISMGIYNFTKNKEGIEYLLGNPNTYRDVAHIHQLDSITNEVIEKVNHKTVKVLGIKNLTEHAGSTSLIYMMKKQLAINYSVVAIEVDKRDFMYFNDNQMISTTSQELSREIMKYGETCDLILVDLNFSDEESSCNDVLYLLEPSTIKLNKLMRKNRNIFNQMQDKKIVLNKSLLEARDIMDFEAESRTKIFHNIPPLNDRTLNRTLDNFLSKLGFFKQKEDENIDKDRKVLGLFKL